MNRACRAKVAAAAAALVLLAMIVSVAGAQREDPPGRILFTQQDVVQAFNLQTGTGYQIGTATGRISGTTLVEFQFAPTGPPAGDALPISFQNKVIITDVEGDQIFFDNNGTGTFHVGIPGSEFKGSGGPLTGTYVLTGGTGKYQTWKVGKTYRYRAVWTSPPNPPGGLGTVYAEISLHREHGEHD